MSNIIQRFMDELPESQMLGIVIAVIVIGLLVCFFGYKLMRVGITVLGFAVGFFLTAFIVNYFIGINWITFPVAIIVGLFVAFGAFRLYEVGIFLVCGVCTTMTLFSLLASYDSIWIYIAAIVAGIIGGSLAVFFIQPVCIFVTAMSGGIITVIEICQKLQFDHTIVIAVVGILLGIMGMIFQFSLEKRIKSKHSQG